MSIEQRVNSSVGSAADTQPHVQVAIQVGTMGARG